MRIAAPGPPPDPTGRPDYDYVERVVGLTLLLALALGCLLVLNPFLPALLWAVILAVSTWPIYVRLEQWLGGRRGLAATIMILGVAFLLLGPIVLLGAYLGESVAEAAQMARDGLERGLPPLPPWLADLPIVGPRLREFWARAASDKGAIAAAIQPHLGTVRDWLIARGGDLLGAIVQIVVSLLVAFFLYRDGVTIYDLALRIMTRLTGHRSGRLVRAGSSTIVGVVQGVLGTALIQAILMGVGFRLAGVPAAVLLGLAAFFVSLVPLGLFILWLPAAIWLASNDATGWAIFTVVWGIFVGTIDNWLRPILILHSSELPLALVLLGILGGAITLGFLGIFLGPVMLAIGFTLLHEWSEGRGAAAPPDPK